MKEQGKNDSLEVSCGGEDIEYSIKRFCRKFRDSEVMREVLSRRFYRKPSEEKRRARVKNSLPEGRK